MRGILLTLGVALGIAAVVAWATGLWANKPEPKPPMAKPGERSKPRVDPGERLAKPMDNNVPISTDLGADPIVVSDSHLSVIDKLPVTSQVEGTLLFIGKEIRDRNGKPIRSRNSPEGRALGSAIDWAWTYENAEKVDIPYLRLQEDNFVEPGQMLAVIDPALPNNQVAIKWAKVKASQAEYQGAMALKEVYGREVDRLATLRARRRDLVSDSEWEIARAQRDKYTYEAASKDEAIKVAEKEWIDAKTLLEYYILKNSIRTPNGVQTKFQNSVVKNILLSPGQAVKKGDPVMEIHYLGRLRAEGLADVQHLEDIHVGMDAEVYPTRRRQPLKTFPGPRNAINAVAVSKDTRDPFIIAASEDKTAHVWQRSQQKERMIWYHGSPVKSVTCTSEQAAKNYCLTGCADGSVRLWDLEHLSAEPLKKWDLHREAITCLAFSPDGKWFAAGSEDNLITVWDTETGKKGCKFDAEDGHLGAITALHFTPDLQLISAGRDNTLRVWTLCEKRATLNGERAIEDRSGTVPQLGVSQDGKYMLFDQGKMLKVMSVKDGSTVGVIKDPSGASPFETLAEFSPDSSLVLTASASDGRLSYWHAPTGQARPYEVRQFIPKDGSPATCAAFGKDTTLAALAQPDRNGKPGTRDAHETFAVTGTKDGVVYLWAIPSPDLVNKTLKGKVSLRDRHVEPSTRQGRVWVEVDNVDGELFPGETVTVVIPREAHSFKK